MSDTLVLNPRPMLQGLIDKEVRIRLKWGLQEYTGILVSTDLYMNFLLNQTKEHIDGKPTGTLGKVLFRCNNVLWIGENVEKDADDAAKEGAEAPDAEMTG